MKLYDIIQALRTTQGNIAKQAILDQHKDNELFRGFMQATYDPGINYYMKKAPVVSAAELATVDLDFIDWIVGCIAGRVVTGKQAAEVLKMNLAAMDKEGQELVTLMLNRKIGADVGDTMVLHTWPTLYFIPPYMRCSLMDEKAKARFAALPRFYVQTKCDGQFAYIIKRKNGKAEVYTRQGSKYPQAFADMMAFGLKPGNVMVGELEVMDMPAGCASLEPTLLDRKTGNGILNSVLKDGAGLSDNQTVRMTAWDMLTEDEFVQGKSTRKYSDRLDGLKYELDKLEACQITLVQHWEVTSLAEAFAIYSEHTSRGLEGCVAKDPDSLWKDGTSKDNVKMKIKFEAEYRCTGMYEGEGEMEGMMGGINIATEDGLLANNCGTGFSKEQRMLFWSAPDHILNEVVMISANDITQSRDSRKLPALSLCAFEEVRYDKQSAGANTYAEVVAILEAAKGGKKEA